MKTQILTLFIGLISIVSFAQKAELKAAEKAIKKQNYTVAILAMKPIESSIENAKSKYRAKYYFLRGQAFAGKKEYTIAAKSFNDLMAYEKKIKKSKYTPKATPMLNKVIQDVSQRAIKLYNAKDYKNATGDFYTTFLISPKDTSFLYNAAVSAYLSKDYEASLKYYKKLKNLGYTGVSVQYLATNKSTGKVENLGSKIQRNLMVKAKQYIKPEDKVSKSKQATIIKNIAYLLKDQGKNDEAILAIKEAREANPKDLNLLLAEADLYIKLKKMDKFAILMKEAIEMDPNNPTLYYNLGVVNFNEGKVDDAKKYYKKAIELKPDYSDAYMNLSVVILDKEKEIIEEMNKNLSNFKKYEALEKQQKEVYKEALPYLEKADSLNRSIDTVRSLLNIYDTLEIDDKSKEYRALYKSMK